MGLRECRPCAHAAPHAASLSPSLHPLVPWGRALGTPGSPSALSDEAFGPASRLPGRGHRLHPAELTLTCSLSSCSPRVEMPPVEVRKGVLGRRHTRFSRSQDTLGFRVRGQQWAQDTW